MPGVAAIAAPPCRNSLPEPLSLFALLAQVGLRPRSVLLRSPAHGDLLFFHRERLRPDGAREGSQNWKWQLFSSLESTAHAKQAVVESCRFFYAAAAFYRDTKPRLDHPRRRFRDRPLLAERASPRQGRSEAFSPQSRQSRHRLLGVARGLDGLAGIA